MHRQDVRPTDLVGNAAQTAAVTLQESLLMDLVEVASLAQMEKQPELHPMGLAGIAIQSLTETRVGKHQMDLVAHGSLIQTAEQHESHLTGLVAHESPNLMALSYAALQMVLVGRDVINIAICHADTPRAALGQLRDNRSGWFGILR